MISFLKNLRQQEASLHDATCVKLISSQLTHEQGDNYGCS